MIRALLLCSLSLALAPRIAAADCGVSAQRSPIARAAFQPEGEAAPGVSISFLGHASFEIETPGHIRAVTDYNGVNIPAEPPDVATMNHAHSTHYDLNPDPRIGHVLHGWRDDGGPVQVDVTVGDLRIRNLPTNIRNWNGGTEQYGNSVFVFETGGLCIAHLGHLHHLLTPDDVAILGPLDVVMAPVDGMWTMSLDDMMKVIDSLHPRLVIPYHYYDAYGLARFVSVARASYPVRQAAGTVRIGRPDLPAATEVLVVPGPRG